MALGDIGGVVTELVISCRTPESGDVDIAKGDALKLSGSYTVTNAMDAEDAVFGQALASTKENGAHIPVKVRGICVFAYVGETAPVVDGASGILASTAAGRVKKPSAGNGVGINVKVDTAARLVHVLL